MYDNNNRQQQISRTEFNTPNFLGQMDNAFGRAIGLWLEKKHSDREFELNTRKLDIEDRATKVAHLKEYRNELHTLGQANQELYDAQYTIARDRLDKGIIKKPDWMSTEDFLHELAQKNAWRLPHFQNNLASIKALKEHIDVMLPGMPIGSGGYSFNEYDGELMSWDEWLPRAIKKALNGDTANETPSSEETRSADQNKTPISEETRSADQNKAPNYGKIKILPDLSKIQNYEIRGVADPNSPKNTLSQSKRIEVLQDIIYRGGSGHVDQR